MAPECSRNPNDHTRPGFCVEFVRTDKGSMRGFWLAVSAMSAPDLTVPSRLRSTFHYCDPDLRTLNDERTQLIYSTRRASTGLMAAARIAGR